VCESNKKVVDVAKGMAAIEAHKNKEEDIMAKSYYIEEKVSELVHEYCDNGTEELDPGISYDLEDAITKVLRNNGVNIDSDMGKEDDPIEEEEGFDEDRIPGGRGFIGGVETDRIKEMIQVQINYMLDQGKGNLECKKHIGGGGQWKDCSTPSWNWGEYEYRMKQNAVSMDINEVAKTVGREVKITGAVSYDKGGNVYMASSRRQ